MMPFILPVIFISVFQNNAFLIFIQPKGQAGWGGYIESSLVIGNILTFW
jgi:hypothetical protein